MHNVTIWRGRVGEGRMCNCAPAHAIAIMICVFLPCHPKGNYPHRAGQIGRCPKEASSEQSLMPRMRCAVCTPLTSMMIAQRTEGEYLAAMATAPRLIICSTNEHRPSAATAICCCPSFFRVFVRRGAGVQTAKCQECHGDSGTTDDAGGGRSGRVVFVHRELDRLNSKCGSAQLGHAQCFGHALWSRSVPASALSPVLLGGSA